MPKLTPKQACFVEEYLVDLNATQAAIRAGYSEKTADQQGSRLLANVKVAAAITKAQAKRSERTEIDQDFVLNGLTKNLGRAMVETPVLDRKGEPTGEYIYNGSVANRSLELIGKHLGMFVDRVEHSGPDGDPIEVDLDPRDTLTAKLDAILARRGQTSVDSEPDEG